MAQSVKILLSVTSRKLQKLLNFGAEHGWRTSQQTLKNATIALNIITFMLDLRYDPVFSQIIRKEGIPPLSLILRELNRYAGVRGYGVIKERD